MPIEQIRPTWRDVRNYCDDIKYDLPEGAMEYLFCDDYDEVFGSIYALTGDDFSYEELRRYAEEIRRLMLGIPCKGRLFTSKLSGQNFPNSA